MNDLTYQNYLDDPAVRQAIEEDVQRQRHEAIDTYIVVPIKAAISRLCGLVTPKRTTAPNTKPCAALARDAVFEAAIAKGQTRRFDDAKGFAIRVNWGCLWITQENDSRDYVLLAGESFRVTRDGATLAHAMKGASISVVWAVEADRAFAASVPEAAVAPRQRAAGEWMHGVPVRLAPRSHPLPQAEPA